MFNLNLFNVAVNKFILGAIVAFSMFVNSLFAQEKHTEKQDVFYVVTNKNASEQEMKDDAKVAKEKFGVDLKYSKVKRNSKGEITAIKIEFSDAEGHKGMTQIEGDEPIAPIQFYKKGSKLGFGQQQAQAFAWNDSRNDKDADAIFERMGKAFIFEDESKEKSGEPRIQKKSIIIKQKDGEKPEIIVDGKRVEKEDLEKDGDFQGKLEFKNEGDGPFVFKFNDEDVIKIDKDEMEKFSKELGDDFSIDIEKIKSQFMKMIPEMEKLKDNFGYDKSDEGDIKSAKEELKKAKEEMEKAREEMKKAKEELEKSRTKTPTRKA